MAENEVDWSAAKTVGQLLSQLSTLAPETRIGTAYFVNIAGKQVARVTGTSLSWERITPQNTLEYTDPSLPKSIIIWATNHADKQRIAELESRPVHVFDKIGADRLADEVASLIRNHVLDSRSPAGDALLDYREPPNTERSDRIAALESQLQSKEAELQNTSRDYSELRDAFDKHRENELRLKAELQLPENQRILEIRRLEEELQGFRTMSTVEIMCENESVRAHVTEWENRCLRAESELQEARQQWRCFHCDEVLATKEEAELHFGSYEHSEPSCLIARAFWEKYRENEKEIQRLRTDIEAELSATDFFRSHLGSYLRCYRPFKECRSVQDVFFLYDSMEGRALSAESQLTASEERLKIAAEALENARKGWLALNDWRLEGGYTSSPKYREPLAAINAALEQIKVK